MKITFTTNLDLAQRYVSSLNNNDNNIVPKVGDKITFCFDDNSKSFDLEICSISYIAINDTYHKMKITETVVELHIPRIFQNINSWEEYFKRHVSRF